MNENLNLEYNKKQLLLKALKKYKSPRLAAPALGICERTVGRMIWRYGIKRDFNGYYEPAKTLTAVA
jgi:hypothetical protein